MGEVVPARTSPTLHPPSPPTMNQLSLLFQSQQALLIGNGTIIIIFRPSIH